jgi:hypothetical protein
LCPMPLLGMIDYMEYSASPHEQHIPPLIAEHIVLTPGTCGGKPRIAGHRIRVQNIAIWHERLGYCHLTHKSATWAKICVKRAKLVKRCVKFLVEFLVDIRFRLALRRALQKTALVLRRP